MQAKKLTQLDMAAAWCRHISEARALAFCSELFPIASHPKQPQQCCVEGNDTEGEAQAKDPKDEFPNPIGK
eukprot:12105364-Prorocentrum_lima.AAC.1